MTTAQRAGAARLLAVFAVVGAGVGVGALNQWRAAQPDIPHPGFVLGAVVPPHDTTRHATKRHVSQSRRPSPPQGKPARTRQVEHRAVPVVAAQVDTPPSPRPVRPSPVAFLDRAAGDTDKVFSRAGAGGEPEAVILELQIDRLTSGTLSGYRVRTEALLPVSQVLALAEVGFRLSPEGHLEARIDPGAKKLVIDAHSDTMTYAGRTVRIEPEFRLLKDGELYIGAERLGDLLGVRFVVNWSDLSATMIGADSLPVAMRFRRDAARANFRARTGDEPADYALGIERHRVDGLVLDYNYYAPGGQSLDAGTYDVRLGADAFGGSLVLGAHSVGPANAGVAHGEASWTGVWEQSPWIKQVQIGDGFGGGLYPQEIRGLSVTNSPFARQPLVGLVRYPGQLSPGWSIEAYQGGQLVALDSTNTQGRFALDLPVVYGDNPVDIIAYGPLGQIQHFNQTYRILGDFLPAKRFEYSVSGGQCRDFACDDNANLDLHYGVSPRWTVRGGVDQFWRSGAHTDLTHPYAQVSANPINAWVLDAAVVGNGLAQLGLAFEPSVDLRLSGVGTVYDTHVAEPLLTPIGRNSALNLNGFWRPLPSNGLLFLQGAFSLSKADLGTFTTGRLDVSTETNNVRVTPYARFERQTQGAVAYQRNFVGVDTRILPRAGLGPVLGPVFFRVGAEAMTSPSPATLNTWYAFASRPVWRSVTLEVGANWNQFSHSPTFLVTLNSYLDLFHYVATAADLPGGGTSVSQVLQGSVMWNGATGSVTTSPNPSIERAGVAGRVFVDENGNGRYDPGEHGLPGIRVIVGGRMAMSDSSGTFRVWDLLPFEPVRLYVDSASIDSPLLVPEFGLTTVELAPNRFRTLDVPISPAGVIEGRVVRRVGGATETMPAVVLVLTDRKSGVKRRFSTFSDGTFYAMGVKPGDYELMVDPRTLDGWQLKGDPLRFSFAPTPEGAGRSGLELVLTPR